MSSILQKLTEGIVHRSLEQEGATILAKWEETGLLEGIESDRKRKDISLLLENQARELLREASTMEAGNVEGFASVAFPIVRRVFADLIANDIVSVQPMSLPAGLIFFMDFTVDRTRLSYTDGLSVYGGGVVGQQITGGVSLSDAEAELGFFSLNQGYSSPTGSAVVATTQVASGTVGGAWGGTYSALGDRLVQYDPDLSGSAVAVCTIPKATFSGAYFNDQNLVTVVLSTLSQGRQVRRLSREDPQSSANYMFVVQATGSETAAELNTFLDACNAATFAIFDRWSAGGGLGSIRGNTPWGLEAEAEIPEIEIKVDSIAVTAITKKLKAVWSPELGQDLQAYHNLDAEVELTSILSEHVALEVDREILQDLVKGATGATYYWSRQPGNFVDRATGASIAGSIVPDFTGNISQWYESLLEVVNDASAQIYRKTLRGGANFIVTSPEVASILEMTNGFRASITPDETKGSGGALKIGSLSNKWDIFIDPYFYRNVLLVGRKGASFLESGYVYAPYVPLQITPTIFDPESFVPRKGLLTRYATQMVRPDFYSLVIVRHLLGGGV